MWRSWKAPFGKGVTFVELFFDLVFVFAVTSVTSLAIHDLTWSGVGRALLVFWLVWWAWTQITWALNGADTTLPWIRAGTMTATVVALLMAVSIEGAFEPEGGLWFVVPYVLVRGLGLVLYFRVVVGDAAQFAAVRSFASFSLLGLAAAVAGGMAGPNERAWWWLGTVALDLVAALVGGRHQAFNLQGPHFAERHGLFIIIALGESLLVVAGPVADSNHSGVSALVLVAAGVLACLLWWTYFGWFKDRLEHELAIRLQRHDPQFARDVYSLMHFPLVVGIVGVAVGLEAMVAHPSSPLAPSTLALFAGGLAVFVASTIPMWLRAGRGALPSRIGFSMTLPILLWLVRGQGPQVVLLVAALALSVLVLAEAWSGPHGAARAGPSPAVIDESGDVHPHPGGAPSDESSPR